MRDRGNGSDTVVFRVGPERDSDQTKRKPSVYEILWSCSVSVGSRGIRIFYCENNILSGMIFLMIDRLVWEGRFSTPSQTTLAKGIFTYIPY